MKMEKPRMLLDKEAPVKGIVAQVVTMLNGQAQRYVVNNSWNKKEKIMFWTFAVSAICVTRPLSIYKQDILKYFMCIQLIKNIINR